jgi:hypothetical protein
MALDLGTLLAGRSPLVGRSNLEAWGRKVSGNPMPRTGCVGRALQVVADMPGTVSESARVLSTGGHFCYCVSHPMTDVGHFDGHGPKASFTVRHDYFANRRVDDSVQRNGLKMRFRGWTHSLEDYVLALERAGLKLEALREPRPSDGAPAYEGWRQVPLFLMARSVKG